ncbi:MAG TPA: hypothetical protein VG917_02230 [Patescibacteria group bacterium]|nr:hypothetical protein [Patescibacteria group bacterium]
MTIEDIRSRVASQKMERVQDPPTTNPDILAKKEILRAEADKTRNRFLHQIILKGGMGLWEVTELLAMAEKKRKEKRQLEAE